MRCPGRARAPWGRRSTCCSAHWKPCSQPTASSCFSSWELMTLATVTLVAMTTRSRQPTGGICLSRDVARRDRLPGCRLSGAVSPSGSLSFAVLLSGHVVSGPMRHGLFALFFLGFGVKAGVIPLHGWLPEAHPAAPTSVSALMSAVLITAGVYGLFKVCAFGLGFPTSAGHSRSWARARCRPFWVCCMR